MIFAEYVQPLMQYLHQHPQVGISIAFLIAFIEALPLVGTIIPGSVTMTGIGTLIGTGIMPGTYTLLWMSIGALIGDCLGYWVGWHFKDRLHHMWPFNKHPKWLRLGEEFFEKHGGKSIIIGRFVGPARSTIPMIAGLLKIEPVRFFPAAILSAILWAIVYTAPGILIGAVSLEMPPAKATEFILFGAAVVIGLWFAFWLIQYFFKYLVRFVNQQTDRCWNWLSKSHSRHAIIKLITNQQRPNDHHQLTLILFSLLFIILFLILFFYILVAGPHNSFNLGIFNFLQSLRGPKLYTSFVIITMLGYTKLMLGASLIVSVLLAVRKQWRASLHLLVLTVFATLCILFFKHFGQSPRPQGFNIVSKSGSFPSGHTGLTTITVGFLTFLTAQLVQASRRWIPYTIGILAIFLVGLSRLYLGAHWFTDVLGSYLLCSALVMLTIVSYRRMPNANGAIKLNKLIWFLFIFIGIGVPAALNLPSHYQREHYRYQPKWDEQHVKINDWWQHPKLYLPIYRENRFGQLIQPFNIEWAAPLKAIREELMRHNWKPYNAHLTLQSTLRRLASYKPEYHMPVFPWLYHNKPPVIVMVKSLDNGDALLELRLWRTKVFFIDNPQPLWIGSLNYHTPPKKLLTLHRRYMIEFKSGEAIKQLLSSSHDFQTRVITVPMEDQPPRVQKLGWNGEVLLLRGV